MPTTDVSTEKRFRIVRLKAENIRRLKAIEIEPPPKGGVIVAGANGAGKTSLLDSFLMAMAGGNREYENAIRQGQDRAEITVDLGAFIVTKKIMAGKQVLEVKTAEGHIVQKPQQFLDSILGDLSFDPLEFTRMHPTERIAMLMGMAGLKDKLAEIDADRERAFTSRTDVNRTVRDVEGETREMRVPPDGTPAEPVDVTALVKEKNRRQAVLYGNDETRRLHAEAITAACEAAVADEEAAEAVERAKAVLESVQDAHGDARVELDEAEEVAERRKIECSGLTDPDMTEIDAQIAASQSINEAVRDRNLLLKANGKLDELNWKAGALTDQIGDLDRYKAKLLADAKFPIPGLSFDGKDVLLNGIHFGQLSSAETLQVSLAMAMAVNPQLRVIRITDGSLLDDDSMKLVCDAAAENDFQVWIECVGDRDDATVIIEDGMVRQPAAEREVANA